MAHAPDVSSSDSTEAEHWLWRSLRADGPAGRIAFAEAGLALPEHEVAPDTRVLLLRQVYLAHLELRQLRRAAEVAEQMAQVGPLRDIAHHDRARALYAAGEAAAAVSAQRLAARVAPTARKAFQLWNLATVLHFAGDATGALQTLTRAMRYAQKERPLLRAHGAFIRLCRGEAPEHLADILADLRASPSRGGYGQYLLGMIAYHMGDRHAAVVHLRGFLARNAQLDLPKALTLREELRRARTALAELESD